MRGKKGVQLAINSVVIIILAVAALAFGVRLIYGIFSGGEEVLDSITPSQEAQLDSLLEKERIAASPSSRQVNKGKETSFALGILNTGQAANFLVNASISAGYGGDEEILYYDYSNFALSYIDNYVINQGEKEKFLLIASVPGEAPDGVYIINVYVCSGDEFPSSCSKENLYSNIEKLYLVVG
ncbi:hypothetical protein JXB11_00355 [Candidatus Woesearchaeota archaeon]|nr:hypothetical protein [Candidatus Woesearchaeota archaeon]